MGGDGEGGVEELVGVDPGERSHPETVGDLPARGGRGGGAWKPFCFAGNSQPRMLLSSPGIHRGHKSCEACALTRISSQPSTSDSSRGAKHVHLPKHCP